MSGTAVQIARTSLGLSPYVPPEGALEAKIATIFAEVFGFDAVGATDDFFELGGDSLIAETLSLRISEDTGRELPISALALQGSPRKIAALLEGAAPAAADPASKGQPPIFMVHGGPGYVLYPPDFVAGLRKDQPVHIFEIPGFRGGTSYDRIEDIAGVYVAQIEQTYPSGPVLLGAFCLGAMIALEIAKQMAARGRTIAHLVLLDPGNPYKLNKAKKAEFQSNARAHKQSQIPFWQRYLPPLKWLDPWRRNTRANDIRRIQRKMTEKRLSRSPKSEATPPLAIAKLYAAYEHYQADVYPAPVTIICTHEREKSFGDSSSGWARLLPTREVHALLDTHQAIASTEAARAMQVAFDAALARAPGRLAAAAE